MKEADREVRGLQENRFCALMHREKGADVIEARNELGFIAGTSAEEGLSATIQWFGRVSPRRHR